MATTISLINLKGGVGKTSTTIALADFLTSEHQKRVLVIDLDPQTNATVALMGEDKWLAKDKKGETLHQLFQDKIDKTNKFNIKKSIVKKASNIWNTGIDLLPSSLGLIETQDKLPLISAGQYFATSPVTILKDALGNTFDDYDVVLIDCPPNLGIITLNGILISDYYLIPTVPDILSTYGIPQIVNRIGGFAKETSSGIEPLGIVISMFRAASKLHSNTVVDLQQKAAAGNYPRVFDTIIPLTVKAAEAADYGAGERKTVRQKYGYGVNYDTYYALSEELLKYV